MRALTRLGRWRDSRLRIIAGAAASLIAWQAAEAFVHIGQGAASKWGDTTIGTGATITWGFMPDGTLIDPAFRIDPFGSPDVVGATGGSNVSQLRTLIDTNHGTGSFDAAIQRALDTWSSIADIRFEQVTDPGTLVGAQGSTTPNIRIGAFLPEPDHFFEATGAVGFGPPGFPGPNNDFPESGDILFNLNGNKFGGQQTPFHIAPGSEDITAVDFFNFGDDLEGLFLHELGHAAIGLAHPPWDGETPDQRVMYVGEFGNPDAPFCCQSLNRELHPDDIAGARFVYGLKGDYNDNGTVDPADYTVWRDSLGQTGMSLAADGDRSGTVDAADYDSWRANFGAETVELSGSGSLEKIPEPHAGILAGVYLCAAATRLSRRRLLAESFGSQGFSYRR